MAAKTNPKVLVDTSAVPAALGQVPQRQREQFKSITEQCQLFSSVYVRMESIRRFVRSYIRIAVRIAQFKSVSDALVHLEQDFGIRDVKATVRVMSEVLRRQGALSDCDVAAEEIGRLAVLWLAEFDAVFSSQINNVSKCQIGGMNLEVDFNCLLDDLQRFYADFSEPVLDCEINEYLRKSRRARKVRNDAACSKLSPVAAFNEIVTDSKHIDCKTCSKIGDMVISLEVPQSMGIAHVDASYDALCAAQQLASFKIPSERSLYSEADLANNGPNMSAD